MRLTPEREEEIREWANHCLHDGKKANYIELLDEIDELRKNLHDAVKRGYQLENERMMWSKLYDTLLEENMQIHVLIESFAGNYEKVNEQKRDAYAKIIDKGGL